MAKNLLKIGAASLHKEFKKNFKTTFATNIKNCYSIIPKSRKSLTPSNPENGKMLMEMKLGCVNEHKRCFQTGRSSATVFCLFFQDIHATFTHSYRRQMAY